ncbi:MAG: DUF4065 domain-containing protein [Bacteroidetes bacterium]|nr:DUF4065 domain-containing protein [Bacteroidota bacterium]MBU1371363.1 DUF4065 domain-containing protein [Bacteroidota bacterium]MBU1485850.1 DUF4065 domain-containing protein [Bacteroidota bacterium]MBU1762145.1 DUF4065 domain-containing protein [Bacteroidota bacterium]MBU2045521.1 DUF4065 domain-containing protein [Bacteroidota bacterium]
MSTIHTISDYIIFRLKAEGENDLSALKHQKLLYYIQAWHLAFFGKRAFDSDFQAWIHGPVNREIYEVYKDRKYLYSEMKMEDIQNMDSVLEVKGELKEHVDTILETYAKYTAIQLEIMTHDEDPWIEARKGYSENERCEVVISNETMKSFYANRLN